MEKINPRQELRQDFELGEGAEITWVAGRPDEKIKKMTRFEEKLGL